MALSPPVHPGLRPYVASWVGFDLRPDVDSIHRGAPSPALTVIVSFGEPLDVGWPDGSQRDRYWLLAAGLHTGPALIRTHGYQHGIQLSLTPAGSRALLGLPAAALAEVMTDHQPLPLGIPDGLRERAETADWAQRFDLLTDHLLALAGTTPPRLDPELAEAWRVLERTYGQARIHSLATHVGWSRRHLAGRFRTEFGITPKQAARLHRFQRARALHADGHRLAEVAALAGYADQAHLNRDWRLLAGQTPTEAEFPIVALDLEPTVARRTPQ